jgi:hypothetical protein
MLEGDNMRNGTAIVLVALLLLIVVATVVQLLQATNL